MSRSVSIALLIILLVAAMLVLLVPQFPSQDLRASWLAGVFFEQGRYDQIYPADTDAYTMLPPSQWAPYMAARGHEGNIFPFIYPPLWAAAFGWLGTRADFQTIAAAAGFINTALLGGMLLLAWKAAGSRMSPVLFVAIGLPVLILTTIGGVGLLQNQPQILVSFLMVLALERTRAGAGITAGAALALAAAIKVYPAAFALLWLAGGHRRAFISFLLAGGALALASVAVAGWPLHEEFLRQLALIRKTIVITRFSYSLDPMIGQLFFSDEMRRIPGLGNPPGAHSPKGWFIIAKPLPWNLASTALMVLAIATAFLLIRRRAVRDVWLLWPLAFTLFAWVSPISWGYHYLPAVAFAPVLAERFGALRGGMLLALLFVPELIPLIRLCKPVPPLTYPAQIAGTLAMAGYALSLYLAARRGKPAPAPGPAPG